MADKGDSGGGLTMLRDGAHYVYAILSTKPLSENLTLRLFTNVLNSGHLIWLREHWNRILLGVLVEALLILFEYIGGMVKG